MITIDSWDDLVETGADIIMKKIKPDEIKIRERFVFQIRIRGDSWDGSIDYRGANFILELQKAVNRVYTELYGEEISLKSLSKLITVKVKVVEGSSLFEINIGAALSKMVGTMSSGEILLLTGMTLATVAGCYTIKKVLDYKKEKETHARQMEKDEKIADINKEMVAQPIDKLTSTIDKALDVIETRDLQAPTRKLVRKLAPDDMIMLPDKKEYSAKEAKKIYPRKAKAKRLSGNFDAIYTIRNIDLYKKPPEFTIENHGLEFKAGAELANDDIEQISRNLENALKSGEDFTISLHVFILYNERKIISASIVGTGEPRPKSQDINDLIQMW